MRMIAICANLVILAAIATLPDTNPMRLLRPAFIALAVLGAAPVVAQVNVLNLYSARHYQTDEQLYDAFTKQTGIRINRVEADDAALLERLRTEGKNSPADVILMVDAARLWHAEQEGLFQPVQSKVLDERIPANLHGSGDKGAQWYGFSTRARVIVYNKVAVKPDEVATYEALSDP